ncbi:MAG: metallophosphoesterase [Magnetococcales bacterium]|nr:metallophosphoesterase [Magnetococcales bacterium]
MILSPGDVSERTTGCAAAEQAHFRCRVRASTERSAVPMRFGLISDTHDHIVNIRKALALFRERRVEMVLHAGDFCSPAALLAFREMPFSGVLGNNDGEVFGLMRAASEIGGRLERDVLEMEIAPGQRLVVYHGYSPAVRQALVACGSYTVAIFGHTHKVEDRQAGVTRVLNPGSAHGFVKRPTAMVFDTVAGLAELLALDV